MIKKFKCGLCSKDERISMTRKGLRKHLKSEHLPRDQLTNTLSVKDGRQIKQRWWIEEEFK